MQNEEQPMTSGERELEMSLKRLQPSASEIDPLAMAFAAGRRAGRRSLLGWRIAAVVLALGFTTVSIQRFSSPSHTTDRSVAWQAPPEDRPPIRLAELSYARMNNEVLQNGIAALPSPHWSGSSDVIYRAADSLIN